MANPYPVREDKTTPGASNPPRGDTKPVRDRNRTPGAGKGPAGKGPSGSPGNKRSGGGGGGGGTAESRAIARENEAKAKAAKRFLEQASNLEAQAKALKYALDVSFKQGLDKNLANLDKNLKEALGILQQGHALRATEFRRFGSDTEKAAASEAEQGLGNLVRERQDTMSALLEQGAGETDALKSMVLSARNWAANANDSNRAYFDTMRSVNQGIMDLNVDTQSALANTTTESQSERARQWQEYYNRRSETWTQLGNIRGQQRDYYAQVKEMGGKTPDEKAAKKASEDAYMNAAKEAGNVYKQPGLPDWIKNYKGQEQLTARQANTDLAATPKFQVEGKAQGGTLRKWGES
jgi:hypothetical protein